MKKRRPPWRFVAGAAMTIAALTHILAPVGMAQNEEAPRAATQEEVEELRKQVYELNKALRQLQVQTETDKAAADDKVKKTPVIAAGPDGFSLTSPDKAFQLKLGARLGFDVGFFRQDEELENVVGDEQDGTGFRFARIKLSGKLWDNITFNSEWDFAGEDGASTPVPRDVYAQVNDIPYGGGRGFDLRLGHFKEPLSLEELNSVVIRTFNEKSLMNVFVPSRNAGIQIADALIGEKGKERLSWQLGVFKETDDWPSSNDSDEDQGYQFTGRVSGLPIYKEDGRKLLHLGLAYSKRNPDGAILPYAVRPETRLSLFRYVDANNRLPVGFRLRDAVADDVDLYAAELAGVYGPFSLQGEYVHSAVDTVLGGDMDFSGYYVQASYFLTGEHRPYRHENGIFGAPKPNKPFGWKAKDGWGAWEVATRYSSVDMNDSLVRGGQQDSYTLGLNWYLNNNTRITWNYIYNQVEHDLFGGDFDHFQMRFQYDI